MLRLSPNAAVTGIDTARIRCRRLPRARQGAGLRRAFHMIVTDPAKKVMADELPSLVEEGYTSFRIYLTYDDLKQDDRQILEYLAAARREGAMAMISGDGRLHRLVDGSARGHRHSVRPGICLDVIGLQRELIPPPEMARIVGAYPRAA